AFAGAEDLRDLLVRSLLEVVELDDLALRRGQLRERGVHRLRALLELERALLRRGRGARVEIEIDVRPTLLSTPMLAHEIHRDREEPGPHAAALVEVTSRAVEPEERVLRDLARELFVTQRASHHAEHDRRVAAEE